MAVISIAGRKGGIGKSTLAGNLAAEFDAMGRAVHLIDADPQHSLIAWSRQGDGFLARSVSAVDSATPDGLKGAVRKAQKEADVVIIDTPPGMPEVAYQAALLADLALLPCGPSPLDMFPLKEALAATLRARAQRRSKKPRIRFVPSKVLLNTVLGRNLSASLEGMGKKVLPPISQRVAIAEAVATGLTIREYAIHSPAHAEFETLAKAVLRVAMR